MGSGALDLLRFIARAAAWTVLVALVLILLGYVALQTAWTKNQLRQLIVRQADRYLNGSLAIERLSGSLLTGIELDKVALRHEGQVVVAIDKMTLRYSPLTMISRGLVLDALTLEQLTVLLDRNDAGWNFFRFVKTRQNTGGGGPPPITFESITLKDSHVIVRDQGRTIHDVTDLDGGLRLAWLKPDLRISLEGLSARTDRLNARRVSGEISTQAGLVRVSDLVLETDRSSIQTEFDWQRQRRSAAALGAPVRPADSLKFSLAADKLSLPEVALFFKPLEGIALEPSVDIRGAGTLDHLAMDVQWASTAGNFRGPVVADIEGDEKSIEGTLNVQNLNLAPFIKRPDRQTRITGESQFTLGFPAPGRTGINASFRFTGPEVQGLGYRAENVRATGQYRPGLLRFDASGIAYGAVATSKGAFHFPSGGMLSYELDGMFRNLDLRRLPERLNFPAMESRLAGQYEFRSRPGAWSGNARLGESVIEGANVGEGTVVAAGSQSGMLNYSGSGSLAGLNPSRFAQPLEWPLLEDPRFVGNLTGTFDMTGSGRSVDELVLHTNATVTNSAMAGARFPSARVDARFENRNLTMAFDGAFEDLSGPAVSDSQALKDARLNGTANMTVRLALQKSLPAELIEVHTNATVRDSAIAGARIPSARVDAQFENRSLTMAFDGDFADLSASAVSDSQALADTKLNGTANMTLKLALPKSLPAELIEVGGTASIASSTVAGVAVDKAVVDGDYADRTANIRALEFSGPTTQGKASGVLALGDTGQSNLTYDVTTSDLEGFAKRFGTPAAGSVHVEGQATGPASDMQFTGKFEGSRLKYGDNVDALAVNASYTGHLPNLDVSRIALDSDAMGSFITIGGVNVTSAEAQLKYAERQLEFRSTLAQESRSLGVEGNALFHPDHHEVHLRALNLMVGQTQWALAPASQATIRYGNDIVRVDGLYLQHGEQRLLVEGTMAVGASAGDPSANDLKIRAERVQVRDINEIMLGRRSLDGVVDLTADVRGNWKTPVVDATFTLVNGAVEGVKFDGLTGTAVYENNRVLLDARLQQTPTAFVTVKGTTPVPGRAPADSPIDLDVQSTAVNLGLVQAFTSEVTNVSGEVQSNVHVGGTLEAPSLAGRVDITQAAFAVVATRVAYNNVTARLTLDGDRVLIDRFEISDPERDQLVALGELGIERRTVGAVNVQVSAARFKVLDNQMGRVEVDADIRVTGDARRPEILGDISTRDGRIEVDRLLERYMSSPYSTEPTLSARATTVNTTATQQASVKTISSTPAAEELSRSALFDAASINVRIRFPDDLQLRGQNLRAGFARIGLGDMNITVGGDLQVRKAPGSTPDLVGTVSVVRGYYDFQGRRFEVLRDSLIRFEGVQPIDPSLMVSAQREISGVTAFVQIRGTARNPELAVSSSPMLDEADILSLIVFNQPINQLAEAQRLNLAERAAALAAGYLTTPLANSIARALDLDLFEIRPGDDLSPTSVMVGQQIGSRLFVAFREEFGAEDRSQLSLEVRINRFLRLVTSMAQGAQRSHRSQRVEANGTDLIFVIDY